MRVLPPVEKTPLLLLRFDAKKVFRDDINSMKKKIKKKKNGDNDEDENDDGDQQHDQYQDLLSYVEELFVKAGIIILSKEVKRQQRLDGNNNNNNDDDDDDNNNNYIYWNVTTSHEVLVRTAEEIRLMKPTTDRTNIMEYFTVATMHDFCYKDPRDQGDNDDDTAGSNASGNHDVIFRDQTGLFSPKELGLLMYRILGSICIDDADIDDNEDGDHDQDTKWKTTASLNEKKKKKKIPRSVSFYYSSEINKRRKYSCTKKKMRYQHVTFLSSLSRGQSTAPPISCSSNTTTHTLDCGTLSLQDFLVTMEYVDLITLHPIPEIQNYIVQQTWKWDTIMPPIHLIRDYYGEEIGFYFAWMGYLSLWLCVPAVIGVCCDLLRTYRNDTIDEDEYTPFFSVFMFLWAVLFTRYWNRYEISLAYQWGTYALSHSHYERQHCVTYNANFVPTHTRISPVTGEQEMYHPTYRRRLRYIGSGVVTIGMLCIAFIVMILSLNVQGFISPQLNPGRWKNIEYHPFYIPYLDTLNEKGNIFDATTSSSWWRSYIPAILHMVCIMVLNTTYSKIATALTQWENHETHQDYANALVLKRFLFEMFDCYVSLFYLAFFERDMDRLRLELVTIFNIDIVRRIATETVVPTIMKKLTTNTTIVNFRRRLWCYRGKSTTTTINNVQDNDDNGAIPATATASVETRTDHTTFINNSNTNDDEYEEFNDFMEIMIQFGYITLFASAYPAAAFIVMIHNYFEIYWIQSTIDRLFTPNGCDSYYCHKFRCVPSSYTKTSIYIFGHFFIFHSSHTLENR